MSKGFGEIAILINFINGIPPYSLLTVHRMNNYIGIVVVLIEDHWCASPSTTLITEI